MTRLAALAAQPHDLLVVGGGIAGCAAAREAARRGLRVALVEARDFGAGTSGATTRLAHGGLRYLEHLDLAQVREGLRERQWLLGAAPHLVEAMPFLFPLPRGRRGFGALLRLGLLAYDALAPRGLPRHAFLTGAEALRREPRLRREAVGRAARFHDARVLHPERLVLAFAQDAAAHGAALANHAEAASLARVAGGWRAEVRDALTDGRVEVRARAVLNAAGPWASRVAGLAGLEGPLARTTRGSHLAFPALLGHAVVMRAGDGRTFFAVPWNEVTLVGTTDLDDAGDPGRAAASAEEVRYLLREAGAFLDLGGARPCYTTAGVRALVRREGVAPGAVRRGHAVLDHADGGAPGLWSVVGGKLTTARAVGRDAVDEVARRLGKGRAPAAPGVLPGHPGGAPRLPGAAEPAMARALGLLGARAASAAGGPDVCARHAREGMVRLAVREEWCSTLPDLLFRRTLAGHAPDLGAHCREAMAGAMGALLGWDAAEREAQLRAAEAEAARRRAGLG